MTMSSEAGAVPKKIVPDGWVSNRSTELFDH